MTEISPQRYAVADKWLKELGLLCAGNMTAADAQLRCSSYAKMLCVDFPMTCFTKEAKAFVASRCKFFPSYGEVRQLLGEHFRAILPATQQLGANPEVLRIAKAFSPFQAPTAEDVAHVEQLTEAFKAEAAARELVKERGVVKPAYVSKLQIALSAPPEMLALRQDLRAALAEHEEMQE